MKSYTTRPESSAWELAQWAVCILRQPEHRHTDAPNHISIGNETRYSIIRTVARSKCLCKSKNIITACVTHTVREFYSYCKIRLECSVKKVL
jgi:hypothetical protein